MHELKIFENDEFGQVRTVMIDDEPWFVGKDVAVALGYKDTINALKAHVDEDDKRGWRITTPSGEQTMVIINESGLYALIFGSKLESARRFKHWVTSEVLPTLRKTGCYRMPDMPVSSIYDRKATSVGEVVNLVRVQQKAMERRGCSQQDISEMMAETFGQFGIPVPDLFLSSPGYQGAGRQEEPDYNGLLHLLREEAAEMRTKPYCGGIAIPVPEFNGFCVRHNVRSMAFKRWLYEGGHIAHGIRTDNANINYTVVVRMSGKNTRCVALY